VLPVVSKGQIIAVCTQVSVLVTVLAFGLRQVAPAIAPAVKDGQAAAVANLLQCELLGCWLHRCTCISHHRAAGSHHLLSCSDVL
jgi:hypothetical protein